MNTVSNLARINREIRAHFRRKGVYLTRRQVKKRALDAQRRGGELWMWKQGGHYEFADATRVRVVWIPR